MTTGRAVVALMVLALAACASAVATRSDRSTVAPVAGRTAPLQFGVSTPGGPLAGAEIAAVAKRAGEWPAIEMWYVDFTQPPPIAALDAVRSRGALPVITWEPWLSGAGTDQSAYSLDRIVAGDRDGYLRHWAASLRSWHHPVTVRFAHEMNASRYPWAEGINNNGPGDFVAAWRHVHDLFAAAGAGNVSWMWSPNTPYPGSIPFAELYPGASYVDQVALDGYNWGRPIWASPATVFGAGLDELRSVAPGKPIVIAETASAEVGGSKADWIYGLLAYLSGERDVTGFVWFQHRKETDWRFDSSPAAAAAFSDALSRRS